MGILEDRRRPVGWAWGSTDGGEWLTVAGSALYTAELAEGPSAAKAPPAILGSTFVLARVERCGTWFKILERAPEALQHFPIIVDRGDGVTAWCACSTWEYDLSNRCSKWTGGWKVDRAATREDLLARYDAEHTIETPERN